MLFLLFAGSFIWGNSVVSDFNFNLEKIVLTVCWLAISLQLKMRRIRVSGTGEQNMQFKALFFPKMFFFLEYRLSLWILKGHWVPVVMNSVGKFFSKLRCVDLFVLQCGYYSCFFCLFFFSSRSATLICSLFWWLGRWK